MRRAWLPAALAAGLCIALPAWAHDPPQSPTVEWIDPASAEAQGSARGMVAVGHDDLGGRGFNADVWVHEQYAYIGPGASRTMRGLKERFCPNDGVPSSTRATRRNPSGSRRSQNPTNTSAEDVVVATARYGPLRRARHRRRRHPGMRGDRMDPDASSAG